MPRNMSFALTTEQIRDRTKTVTRRLGWEFLKRGDLLWAVEKCMGFRPGETVKRLALLRVLGVNRERLSAMSDGPDYGAVEAKREGFPELTGQEFVAMFCRNMRCEPTTMVTRIEFEFCEERERMASSVTESGDSLVVRTADLETCWKRGSDAAAASQVAMLQQRIVELEDDLTNLLTVVQKRHHAGRLKVLGLREAVPGALELLGSERRERARDAAEEACRALRLDVTRNARVSRSCFEYLDRWMRLKGKDKYDDPKPFRKGGKR